MRFATCVGWLLIVLLFFVNETEAARHLMWPQGGPTPYQQKVYARTGHLTRSIKHNPAQTLWMKRYTERDATHYSRVYDYRALYDYPWHVRPPKGLLYSWYNVPPAIGETEINAPAEEPVATPPGTPSLTPAPASP